MFILITSSKRTRCLPLRPSLSIGLAFGRSQSYHFPLDEIATKRVFLRLSQRMLLRSLIAATILLSSTQATQYPLQLETPATLAPPAPNLHHLTLRHAVHLSHTDRTRPALHRTFSPSDLVSAASLTGHSPTQTIRTTRSKAWRPSSDWAYQAQRRTNFYLPRALKAGRPLTSNELADSMWGATLEWEEQEIEVPDVTDVVTVASLAKMTSNAYSDAPDNWYDLDGRWNVVSLGPRRWRFDPGVS